MYIIHIYLYNVNVSGENVRGNRQKWQWKEAPVARIEDHFELRFGSAKESGWDNWLPVALVGPAFQGTFCVQFLIDRNDERLQPVVRKVLRDIDFYLIEKGEPDPWTYAQYHCGTTSNAYSSIHWSFFPKRTPPSA